MASTGESNWESILAEATSRGSNVVPGVILVAVDSTGKEIYSRVSGYNGLGPDAPPLTRDATLWIASCTKLITSISALQCVERGLITLDEPVEKVLPELANKQIVSPKDDGGIRVDVAKTKITLRHLLTHTSGFGYEWWSPVLTEWRKTSPRTTDPSGTVTTLYDLPLLNEPGEGWVYGPGVDWAGILVQRLNDDITLENYFRKNIFEPLGIKADSTTFRPKSSEAAKTRIQERRMKNCYRQADGTLKEGQPGISSDAKEVKEESGGGGLYSCVDDYIVVLQDIIKPEPKLLKKENLEQWLFTPHMANKGAVDALLTSRKLPEAASIEAAPVNHALGGLFWMNDGDVFPKDTLIWGGIPSLRWFANRRLGVAAFFATQVTPPGDPTAAELANKFFREMIRLAASKR